MNITGLKEDQKIQILDIINNNCVANYLIQGKRGLSNVCQWGCDPFH